jgi:hypothetical protein
MTDPTGKGSDVTDASNAPQADKLESADALAHDLAEEWASPEPAAEPAGS